MATEMVLLADDMQERGDVVQLLIESEGYRIVRCSSVEQCRLHLLSSPFMYRILLASVGLQGESLMPVLEGLYRPGSHTMPRPLLWSAEGELGLVGHQRFLNEHCALVFQVPLDVDLLVRVIRLLKTWPTSRCAALGPRPARHHNRRRGEYRLDLP